MTITAIRTRRIQQRDMPAGLSEGERIAYRQGWDRAARKYAKDCGLPHEHQRDGETLSEASRRYFEDREPIAHKAGMSALTRHRKLRGIEIPRATRTRTPKCCPNCGTQVA